jgi:CHAD domain-containing protein
MDAFASLQVNRLLGKLAFQVRHAAKRPDEEAIHDLRVSIRRLSQCLREFRQFFPRHETKKILRQLGKVMDLAAEMRNRDIAIELIGGEGGAAPKFLTVLRQERDQAKTKLTRALVQWRRRDFSRKWRPWLAV